MDIKVGDIVTTYKKGFYKVYQIDEISDIHKQSWLTCCKIATNRFKKTEFKSFKFLNRLSF